MMHAMGAFIPKKILSIYHMMWPFLGAVIYRFPSFAPSSPKASEGHSKATEGKPTKKIKVIGITGTNGKTTVTHLATEILEEAGYKVASISSLRFKIGERKWRNELKMTMPGRMKIQKFLRQAVDAGCDYVVMEVTSEGIKQHRHKFIDFDVAVFTNLTPEHIEAHGGFENYKKAKGELFEKLKIKNKKSKTHIKNKKISIINIDDENAEYFLDFPADEKYGYFIRDLTSNVKDLVKDLRLIKVDNIFLQPNGTEFSVDELRFNLNLLGEFNIYNSLAAICVGLSQGVDIGTIRHALEKFKGVPGRMEVVLREPLTVIVDYAHTPDSLRKVYETVGISNFPSFASPSHEASDEHSKASAGRQFPISKQIQNPNSQKRKLICVLGAAGGGRDKWKRPEMGKIAAQYCDEIILTNEDPYDENPSQILSEIKSGISLPKRDNLYEILDRREAIKKALQIVKPSDVVVITGKGAEPWMMLKRGRIPWDDRGVVKEELKKIQS